LPRRPGRVGKVNTRAHIFPSGHLDGGGEHTPAGTHPLPPQVRYISERSGRGKCRDKMKKNKSRGARERHGADSFPPEVLSGQG